MQQNTNALIIADNMRRVTLLGDIALQLKAEVLKYADISEINTFLINRDLGMSARYGLSASQSAISGRFIQRAEDFAIRWKISPPRIIYYSDRGEVIADSISNTHHIVPTPFVEPRLEIDIDIESRRVRITEPVIYKGRREGAITTYFPIDILLRSPLPLDESSSYREILLTLDGEYVCDQSSDVFLERSMLRSIVDLEDNQIFPGKSIFGNSIGSGAALANHSIIKASVPGIPLVLVAFIQDNLVYGPLASRYVLFGGGALLLILLMGGHKLNNAHNKAKRLEVDVALVEIQRSITEQKNIELSQEIQRRVEVEEALAESRECWEVAIAGTNDGIWDWNIRTGDVFFSFRWKEMLGYDDADIKGHLDEWSKLLHPDDIDRVMGEVQRHLRGETSFYECPQRLLCKNGSYKWILDRGRAMFSANGEAIRMAGSHTDITEQRIAEEYIADRNAQLDMIFSLSPDGFVAFDADRRVKYANLAYLQMTGQIHEKIIGLSDMEFLASLATLCVPSAIFGCISSMRQALIDEGDAHARVPHYRIEVVGKTPRFLDLKLRIANAPSVSQILYVRDVTYEVEVDQMKSDFLSHAAHELRTPMASIFGFSELLITKKFDAQTRKDLLKTIYEQTAWLIEIINELLDLARIESRRGKDFKIQAVAVAPIVDEVVEKMQIDLARWPVEVSLPADLKLVRVDSSKLRQAFTNIISNAVKYSPDGGIIRIEASLPTDSPKVFVGITVTDKGIGMTAQQSARVCERFYRADKSGNIPGTGLGMSIVKEIIEHFGGKIEITSDLGEGTSVTLLLPPAE